MPQNAPSTAGSTLVTTPGATPLHDAKCHRPAVAKPRRRATDLLIGRSAAIAQVHQAIARCAPSAISVIVTGPSGSGKEVVAQAIHRSSPRRDGPFVAVNCGAIPADLLESELFGHEKGAFTGATSLRRGRFEEASGGTILLDEIGDMPLAMQVKLLRVLENRRIQRVGGSGEIAVDVRIISATHRDLAEAIAAGRFREDLYYRLAVYPITLPPLCERPEDIAPLVEHFADVSGIAPGLRFDDDALGLLVAHRWPGNVRELRNVVERASVAGDGDVIDSRTTRDLLLADGPTPSLTAFAVRRHVGGGRRGVDGEAETAAALPTVSARRPIDLVGVIERIERQYILDALAEANGVIGEAAQLLGLERESFVGRMQKHGVARAA